EEKSDVHDFPRRNPVSDDEAENDDPERRELHRNSAIYELRRCDKNGERDPPRDDELELDLLDTGRPPQIAHVQNDQNDDRARQQNAEDRKERPIDRQWN